MTRMHGKDVRVYFGSRDVSGDLQEINPEYTAQQHDVSTFNNSDYFETAGGLKGFTAGITGFYDPALAGFGRQIEDLLGGTGAPLTIVDGDANSVDDKVTVFGSAVVAKRSQPTSVADMIKLNAELQGNGSVGFLGPLLHGLGVESATGSSASNDAGASSANGGRGNLHVTAVTGVNSHTIKVQHSADNSIWADLITFAAVSAATSESKEASGTVNRYLRDDHAIGAASTATYLLAFARY